MTDNSVIRFDGVSFSYKTAPVLEDVSFTIEDKEFAAIIGPNGGGKTTMLKLMLGLLEPIRGAVRILGLVPGHARARVGYMPQQPRLDHAFPVTVTDVVMQARLGGRWKPHAYDETDRATVANALETAGLGDMSNRPFSDLSSGQHQRVLIARALATNPDLLLLDEPTSHLDPSVQNELYELLHRLNENMTIIVVSHDVGFVSKYVQKVICVNRTVALHPVSEIMDDLASKLYSGIEMHIVDHGQHKH